METDIAEEQPGGLAAVYLACRSELLRFLVARTGSATDAEDVLQEVWLRINSQRIGPVSHGRAYLYRVVQNLVLERVREARRRGARERDWSDVVLDQRSDGPEPVVTGRADETLIQREDAGRLAAAIAALPPGAGRAFRLHKIEGLSHAETAAQLGISRKGVEKHMAVAMAHLRRTLSDGELG